MRLRCKMGFHLWHKARFNRHPKVQLYGQRECEFCGVRDIGYAKRNHPYFRKILGEES